jgi:hypothetical protein
MAAGVVEATHRCARRLARPTHLGAAGRRAEERNRILRSLLEHGGQGGTPEWATDPARHGEDGTRNRGAACPELGGHLELAARSAHPEVGAPQERAKEPAVAQTAQRESLDPTGKGKHGDG